MDAKIRDPQQIIALFNRNVALEHGAIYQYLQHAYAIGEIGVGAEIINIARAEMRHMKYFAGIITELGGVVTLERPAVELRAANLHEMMVLGAAAEDEAIESYTAQLDLIDHPGALRVLERVILDEELHKEQWGEFDAEVAELAYQASYPSPGPVQDPALAALLNGAFEEAYNEVLVYLRHYFQSSDWEAKDFLFENSVWKMRQMGLMADKLHELGADPSFPWRPVPIEGALSDRIAQAIAIEQASVKRYQQLSGCPVPHEVRSILKNALGQSVYQQKQMELLRDLNTREGFAEPGYVPIQEAIAPPAAAPRPAYTVGSLIDQPAP
ncbi:ferritin-like domain-containing protein [bacterium]|nr:ferritin-like domain-containing protein [bacterium]